MSDSRLRRRSTSRRSSKRRRRRRSSVSMSSWNSGRSDAFGDEDDDEIRRLAEDDDDDDDDAGDDVYHDDDNFRDRDGNSRNNSRRRKERRRRKSVRVRDEEEGGGGGGEGAEEEKEETMTEEMIVAKINRCKELIESVKLQTWKMSKKMRVLKKARAYVEAFEGKLSRSRGYQQRWNQFYRQLTRLWTNLIAALLPWEMRIKRIESHFGSVVASYFLFLRWLIWISIWLAVLPVCFIIGPELIEGEDHGTSVRKRIPDKEQRESHDLKTIWDAEGAVKYSLMFYGYYGNADQVGSGYRIPFAYLLTSLAAFAYSFVVVLKTMAHNSRQSRLSNQEEEFTFSWKLFTEWDFMIESHETATTKRASIITTFKETILEEQEKVREGNKYLLVFLRVLANFLILMLLALSTYIIQLFVERSREMELEKRKDPNYEAGFWAENELTVIMTLISTLFPNVLDLISLMEQYHPRSSLRLMLARIFVLNLLNLYTLFIALYNKQNDLLESIEAAKQNGTYIVQTNCTSFTQPVNLTQIISSPSTVANSVTSSMGILTNVTSSAFAPDVVTVCTNYTVNAAAETLQNDLCWETMIGQETFKLTIMDTVFVLGQILIIDVFRSYFIKHCNSMCCWDMERTFPEYPDFKTAENLLHLISNQGTIWLGAFFAPGLPLLNLLKLLIMLYVRCWTVMTYNAPQQTIFRASRSNNFYFALLLVMLFLCMLPPLFAIVAIEPSANCGPFSGQAKIYHILTSTMESELPESVNTLIEYAASPGVIMPVFMLLGMTIYYLIAVGRSMREANRQLTQQLEYERTEGRRKVYAMADAKNEKHKMAGVVGWQQAKFKVLGGGQDQGKEINMAQAAFSIMSEMKAKKEASQTSNGTGKKSAAAERIHAVARKQMASKMMQASADKSRHPPIPVAVVKGKQSIKANAPGARDRAKVPLRSAFRNSNNKERRHESTDDVIKAKNKWNQHTRSRRHTKSHRISRDEIEEEETDDYENDEEKGEDEEGKIDENSSNDDDNCLDNDIDDNEEKRYPQRNRHQNDNRSKSREKVKVKAKSKKGGLQQEERKSSPGPPPPPPPDPSSTRAWRPSQTGRSKTPQGAATTDNTIVDQPATTGSVLDRIKMFQTNSVTNSGNKDSSLGNAKVKVHQTQSKSGNNAHTPKRNNRNDDINDNNNNDDNDDDDINDGGEIESDESTDGMSRNQRSRTRSNRKETLAHQSAPQRSQQGPKHEQVVTSSSHRRTDSDRKSKLMRRFSDKKGHLKPYDSDDDDDDEEEEDSDSDDRDSEDEGNNARDKSNGKKISSSTSHSRDSGQHTPKNPVLTDGTIKPKGAPPAKVTSSRESESPNHQIPKLPKVVSKSKMKHIHQHVVEAQIEIVDENKPSTSTKKSAAMKIPKNKRGKTQESIPSPPVPSIRIEDFSDRTLEQPSITTNPSRKQEHEQRTEEDAAAAHSRRKVNRNDDNEADVLSQDQARNPNEATLHKGIERNGNGAMIKGTTKKKKKKKTETPDSINDKRNSPMGDMIETNQGNASNSNSNNDNSNNMNDIMKSKGRLAKWRRITLGLKGRGKRKMKTESNDTSNEAFANRETATTNSNPPSESNHESQKILTTVENLKSQRLQNHAITDTASGVGDNRLENTRVVSHMPSPLIDYNSDDDYAGTSDTDRNELARRRRRKSFLQKRASLASIRSDRPSAVSDDSSDEAVEEITDNNDTHANRVDTSSSMHSPPKMRQRSDMTRNPAKEVIGQNYDGDVIIGITNAHLEFGSSGE